MHERRLIELLAKKVHAAEFKTKNFDEVSFDLKSVQKEFPILDDVFWRASA